MQGHLFNLPQQYGIHFSKVLPVGIDLGLNGISQALIAAKPEAKEVIFCIGGTCRCSSAVADGSSIKSQKAG
jgi:hypothetical protein